MAYDDGPRSRDVGSGADATACGVASAARDAVAAAATDSTALLPAIEAECRAPHSFGLERYIEEIAALPPSAPRAAALALLAVRANPDEENVVNTARSAVETLSASEPTVAAAVAVAAGAALTDHGRWAEAGVFAATARSLVAQLSTRSPASQSRSELWFRAMAVALLVEWNTYGGTAVLDELSAALAVPRARNLLRPYHAPALLAVGQVRASLGEFGTAAVSIARAVQLIPSAWLSVRVHAQAALALVRFRQGNWQEANRVVRSACEVAAELDDVRIRGVVAAMATLEPALASDFDAARVRIDEAAHATAGHWSPLSDTILLNSRIAVVIGTGDWNGMVQLLQDAEEPGYRRVYTVHEWNALWGIALRNSGRISRYRQLLDEWGLVDGAQQHPYYWGHRALREQLDRNDEAALKAARRTRDCISDADDPLGRGWSRIVVGTVCSLTGEPAEGMESYEAARAEFEELGAVVFVRLCTRIIEGTAAELASASGDVLRALTPQQRRVAELVAEGYTSTEIGQILYLSKKTIDFHVGNIVSRLGLSSRREIRRLLQAT